MTAAQQIHTLLTAQRFGGNFLRHLATAGLAADPSNRAKVFQAWPQLQQMFGPGSSLYSEDLA